MAYYTVITTLDLFVEAGNPASARKRVRDILQECMENIYQQDWYAGEESELDFYIEKYEEMQTNKP